MDFTLHLDENKTFAMPIAFIKVVVSIVFRDSGSSWVLIQLDLYQNSFDGSDIHALTHTHTHGNPKTGWICFCFYIFMRSQYYILLFGGSWFVICCFLYFDKCSFCSQTLQCLHLSSSLKSLYTSLNQAATHLLTLTYFSLTQAKNSLIISVWH